MSTYRLPLPWVRPPLSANQRLHWGTCARLARDIRTTTAWLARAAQIPAAAHLGVTLVWAPGDRRRRDVDNLVPTLKPCCDGLVDAGVVADDTPRWMTKHMPLILDGPGRGLWLDVEITDLRGAAGNAKREEPADD